MFHIIVGKNTLENNEENFFVLIFQTFFGDLLRFWEDQFNIIATFAFECHALLRTAA